MSGNPFDVDDDNAPLLGIQNQDDLNQENGGNLGGSNNFGSGNNLGSGRSNDFGNNLGGSPKSRGGSDDGGLAGIRNGFGDSDFPGDAFVQSNSWEERGRAKPSSPSKLNSGKGGNGLGGSDFLGNQGNMIAGMQNDWEGGSEDLNEKASMHESRKCCWCFSSLYVHNVLIFVFWFVFLMILGTDLVLFFKKKDVYKNEWNADEGKHELKEVENESDHGLYSGNGGKKFKHIAHILFLIYIGVIMFFAEFKILKNLLKVRYVIAPLYPLLAMEISSDAPHKKRWGSSTSVNDASWDVGQFFKALVGKVKFNGQTSSAGDEPKEYQVGEVFEAWLELILWILAISIFVSQIWLAITLMYMTPTEYQEWKDLKEKQETERLLADAREKAEKLAVAERAKNMKLGVEEDSV